MPDSNSTAVITAPDKHSKFLATRSQIPQPTITLTGFTLSEIKANLIPQLDQWEEISRQKHLYTPNQIARAEALAQNAYWLLEATNLVNYQNSPEFEEKLSLFNALTAAMQAREKDTWERIHTNTKGLDNYVADLNKQILRELGQ